MIRIVRASAGVAAAVAVVGVANLQARDAMSASPTRRGDVREVSR